VAAARRLAQTNEANVTSAIDVSRDGRLLAVAGRDRAWILDATSLAQVATLPLPAMAFGVAFSPDAREVAFAMRQRTLLRWRIASRFEGVPRPRDFVFAPGTHVLLAGEDRELRALDADTGRQLARAEGGAVRLARPRTTGPIAVQRPDGSVDAVDPSTLAVRARLAPASEAQRGEAVTDGGDKVLVCEPLGCSAFAAGGGLLWHAAGAWKSGISVDARGNRAVVRSSEAVYLLDVANGAQVSALSEPIEGLGFMDMQTVVLGSIHGRLFFVDLASGKVLRELPAAGANASWIAISPAAPLAVLTGLDGMVRLWDTATWEPVTAQATPSNDFIAGLTFSDDGAWLAWEPRAGALALSHFAR
jgi:hypothetical protein